MMGFENISKCRICSSDNVVDVMVGSIPLIHCNSCDIYYLKDMPTQDELDIYYLSNYQITSEDMVKTEKRRIFRIIEQIKLISEIKKFKLPPAKLLDIGCDKGFFMDEARRWGYSVSGVEPSESARSYCSNIGLETMQALNQVNEKFDIITMWHSLEHQLEPTKFLDTIKSLLVDNSYLFIRVPAFDNIWRKIFGSKWIWFQPKNHYYHYTMKSLENLLNTAGFDVIKIEKRKPNNRFTKRVYIIINGILKEKIPIKKRLARIYEDITGVELFAIAKLK
jgi:hypothetical protein